MLPLPTGWRVPGGVVIFPQESAWHSAANSDYFIPCQNAEACREGDLDAQVGNVRKEAMGVEECTNHVYTFMRCLVGCNLICGLERGHAGWDRYLARPHVGFGHVAG